MAVRPINRNNINFKSLYSSGEDTFSQYRGGATTSSRYLNVQKVMNALEILEYPESFYSVHRMSTGRFFDENVILSSQRGMIPHQQKSSSSPDDRHRLIIERQYFDKMCRLFNMTLFRHHPTIKDIKTYQSALKFYIVIKSNLEDWEIDQKKLWSATTSTSRIILLVVGRQHQNKVEITRPKVIVFGHRTENLEIKYCESGKEFFGDLVLL